ncbi:hypothetical protein [Streptomyces bobili]|uniref:hypothetical protein n=1 Tax=Streptomyces bobili TaxID=67280 RepID=UPI000A3A69CF|nr:hypothetical protein [Streptomyces bobili]
MLLLALCAAALIPGLVTGWVVHRRHGWHRAALTAAGVTLATPFVLLSSFVVFPPLGFALGAAAALAALGAFDDGRIWTGVALAGAAGVAFSCAGWAAW